MDNKVVKPLILEIEEAKKETSAAINKILQEHKLPCYLYESIIEDVHNQISAAAQNEVSTVVSEYQRQCQEAEENKESKQETKTK